MTAASGAASFLRLSTITGATTKLNAPMPSSAQTCDGTVMVSGAGLPRAALESPAVISAETSSTVHSTSWKRARLMRLRSSMKMPSARCFTEFPT